MIAFLTDGIKVLFRFTCPSGIQTGTKQRSEGLRDIHDGPTGHVRHVACILKIAVR